MAAGALLLPELRPTTVIVRAVTRISIRTRDEKLLRMPMPRTAAVPLDSVASELTSTVGLVLDLDPDLGSGVREEEWEKAREACRGKLVRMQPGAWSLPASEGTKDDLVGFLIVDGLLCLEIALRERHLFELFGSGDVLATPPMAGTPPLGGPIGLTALREVLLIELGVPFIDAAARWPVLMARCAQRLEAQRHRVAVLGLIAQLPRAEHRLLLALWHLADRWGQVTAEGITVPLPFTHDLLGHLTAARRSTVTLAAGRLECSGAIRRKEDGSWLLTPTAARMVKDIAGPGNNKARAIGETLMLRQRTADARAKTRPRRTQTERARARRRAVRDHLPTQSPRATRTV